eukprot:s818_g16.t1
MSTFRIGGSDFAQSACIFISTTLSAVVGTMMLWAIGALSTVALLCLGISDQRVEDTCEDSALLHAKTYRTSHKSLAKSDLLQEIAEANDDKGPTDCPDEASLDAGVCTGDDTCRDCYTSASFPNNSVPPNATLDRFPNNGLFCGDGDNVCRNSRFNFKNPNDYLECLGRETGEDLRVCAAATITNVGAVCCEGRNACRAATFSLSSAGGCQSDMCCGDFGQSRISGTCTGSSAGPKTTVTGVRSFSCRGFSACASMEVEVSRDVICEEPDFGEGACSLSTFQVIGGGDHVVDCYPRDHCLKQLLRGLDLDLRPGIKLQLALLVCWLVGASISGRDRAVRAWTAGLWAQAVLSSRVHSPNRTPPLDLRSRFYAIARADNLDCPVIFKSSASYWGAIGTPEGSNSVSQSFPSEAEARIYLIAAGFAEDGIQVLP